MVRYLAIACFLICSRGSTRAVQKDKDAVVYVYRYRQVIGRFVAPVVYCDGEPLAHMQNGRYFSVRVAPGRHLFQAEDKQAVVPIHAKPGGAYFIRIWNIQETRGMVMRIDPDQGRAELSTGKITPLDEKKVIDHHSVSTKKVDFAVKDSLSYSFTISAQQPGRRRGGWPEKLLGGYSPAVKTSPAGLTRWPASELRSTERS